MLGPETAARPRVRAALARGAVLFGFWLLLTGPGGDLIADLAVGLMAAAAATWVSLRLLPPTPERVHYGALLRLAWRFLRQSVTAGVDVARRALAPRLSLRPGYLAYSTHLPPGPARAAFGALTSLVPGTLPVGTDTASALIYHCLDVGQAVAAGLAVDEALLVRALGGGNADD